MGSFWNDAHHFEQENWSKNDVRLVSSPSALAAHLQKRFTQSKQNSLCLQFASFYEFLGVGLTLGKGKPKKPAGYATPIKAERIILEVGGNIEYMELKYVLKEIADKLPFAARPVTHEQMLEEKKKQEREERENLNMFTYKHCLDNNFLGSRSWASPYDYKFYGKYD